MTAAYHQADGDKGSDRGKPIEHVLISPSVGMNKELLANWP